VLGEDVTVEDMNLCDGRLRSEVEQVGPAATESDEADPLAGDFGIDRADAGAAAGGVDVVEDAVRFVGGYCRKGAGGRGGIELDGLAGDRAI
jgi:hypothetical protein